MTKDILLQVKSRFIAGFAGLTQHLGCTPMVQVQEDRLLVIYYLPSGRLSYELEAGRDIEAFTLNLLSYAATWQPLVPIADAVIDGTSIADIAGKVEELQYAADVNTPAYRIGRKAVQEAVQRMFTAAKPEQLPALEQLAARYLPVLDLGIKNAAEVRRQQMIEAVVTLTFSLTTSPRVLPIDAWYQLQKPPDRRNRRKPTATKE